MNTASCSVAVPRKKNELLSTDVRRGREKKNPKVGDKPSFLLHSAHTWALCSCSYPGESFSCFILLQALRRAWHCSGRPVSESFSTIEDMEKGWKSQCCHRGGLPSA